MTTMTLTEFLLARIAEDEANARAVVADNFDEGVIGTGDDPWPSERAFAERFTPARVLAECEAKRRIVERLTSTSDASSDSDIGYEAAIEDVLHDLATVYADRPDFREEWRG